MVVVIVDGHGGDLGLLGWPMGGRVQVFIGLVQRGGTGSIEEDREEVTIDSEAGS